MDQPKAPFVVRENDSLGVATAAIASTVQRAVVVVHKSK